MTRRKQSRNPTATRAGLADTVRVFGAPREPVIVTRAMRETEMKRDDLFPSKHLWQADLSIRVPAWKT